MAEQEKEVTQEAAAPEDSAPFIDAEPPVDSFADDLPFWR